MLKNIMLCLAGALFLTLCACEKTTYLNGKVVNKVTGEPVSGAAIIITSHQKNDNGTLNLRGLESDNDGQFSYEDSYLFGFYEISASGFLLKNGRAPDLPEVEKCKVNDININMVPADGLLKLSVQNTSNQTDTLFAAVYSPAFNLEYDISKGFIVNRYYVVNGNSTKIFFQPLASEETVKIYWGYDKRPNYITSELQSAPFMDSIFIPRGDTAAFSISF